MILGAFGADRVLGAVAVVGVVLAAIYMLWAYQRTFQGPEPRAASGIADMVPREFAAVVPVVAVMLLIGVYPKFVLDRIDPSIGERRRLGQQRRGRPGRPARWAAGARARRVGRVEPAAAQDRRGGGAVIPTPAIELGPSCPSCSWWAPRSSCCSPACCSGASSGCAPVPSRSPASPAAAAAAVGLWDWDGGLTALAGSVAVDRFGVVVRLLLLGVAAVGLLYGHHYFERTGRVPGRVLPARSCSRRRG